MVTGGSQHVHRQEPEALPLSHTLADPTKAEAKQSKAVEGAYRAERKAAGSDARYVQQTVRITTLSDLTVTSQRLIAAGRGYLTQEDLHTAQNELWTFGLRFDTFDRNRRVCRALLPVTYLCYMVTYLLMAGTGGWTSKNLYSV